MRRDNNNSFIYLDTSQKQTPFLPCTFSKRICSFRLPEFDLPHFRLWLIMYVIFPTSEKKLNSVQFSGRARHTVLLIIEDRSCFTHLLTCPFRSTFRTVLPLVLCPLTRWPLLRASRWALFTLWSLGSLMPVRWVWWWNRPRQAGNRPVENIYRSTEYHFFEAFATVRCTGYPGTVSVRIFKCFTAL